MYMVIKISADVACEGCYIMIVKSVLHNIAVGMCAFIAYMHETVG